jgi:subtilisin family serine protease
MKKIILLVLITTYAYSQELKTKYNWHNLDLTADGVRGMSTEKAYSELLKDRKSKTVIVGVIDSGIDIYHEDLQSVIWKNPKEIENNGIDDDNNGFVDDINGWDFLGAKDGKDIVYEQLESIRILKVLNAKFGDKPKRRFIKKNKEEYKKLQEIKEKTEKDKKEAEQYLPLYTDIYTKLLDAETILSKAIGKQKFVKDDVTNIKDSDFDRNVRQAKQLWLNLFAQGATLDEVKEGVDHFKEQIEYNLNVDYDPRKIIGDDLTKLGYGSYGNNEVKGPDAMHGTHVAGIIGANRTNAKGAMGVADNVKIMTIRCVPNGDERDKDVANAIKYAVDNGAQIINMSFGKPYSPEKNWVDNAMKYAEDKGVLLVSAAGNDNQNIDKIPTYPSRVLNNQSQIKNWIIVGAQNFEEGENLPATFSNFGKENVDVFAPGVAIYSSVPGSIYKELQGTSMASPAVAGVAALLKSYFSNLTAAQIKDIILKSSVKLKGTTVIQPGEKTTLDFSELCLTGGVVNVYNAVKMAIEISDKK